MVKKFAYIKILPLLCTRFATGTAVQKQKWFIKIFSIFFAKKFGSLKNLPYLCTRFCVLKKHKQQVRLFEKYF